MSSKLVYIGSYIYSWLFKTFTKLELPLFRGQILQHLLHCNARVGGWEFSQDSFYFLCIFLLGTITVFCMIDCLAIILIYVFYNLDSLYTILFCFARVCALFLAFNQQKFYFDCSIPLKFNNLSSCFTTRYTYLIHHIYWVVTMEMFLVAQPIDMHKMSKSQYTIVLRVWRACLTCAHATNQQTFED
jgi:hypothetical protein